MNIGDEANLSNNKKLLRLNHTCNERWFVVFLVVSISMYYFAANELWIGFSVVIFALSVVVVTAIWNSFGHEEVDVYDNVFHVSTHLFHLITISKKIYIAAGIGEFRLERSSHKGGRHLWSITFSYDGKEEELESKYSDEAEANYALAQ